MLRTWDVVVSGINMFAETPERLCPDVVKALGNIEKFVTAVAD